MLKHTTVHIRVSELHTQPVTVPNWELPILRAIHGDSVEAVSTTAIDRAPPDAADEFRRLATRYQNMRNEDGGIGIPYVASVYGQFGVGTDALRRAIEDATETSDTDGLLGAKISSVGG